jgi:hypothetical protein
MDNAYRAQSRAYATEQYQLFIDRLNRECNIIIPEAVKDDPNMPARILKLFKDSIDIQIWNNEKLLFTKNILFGSEEQFEAYVNFINTSFTKKGELTAAGKIAYEQFIATHKAGQVYADPCKRVWAVKPLQRATMRALFGTVRKLFIYHQGSNSKAEVVKAPGRCGKMVAETLILSLQRARVLKSETGYMYTFTAADGSTVHTYNETIFHISTESQSVDEFIHHFMWKCGENESYDEMKLRMRQETDVDVVRAALKIPYVLDVFGLGLLEFMPSEPGVPAQTVISFWCDRAIRAKPSTVGTEAFMNAVIKSMSISGLNEVAYVPGSKHNNTAKLIVEFLASLIGLDEYDKLCSLSNTIPEVSSTLHTAMCMQ